MNAIAKVDFDQIVVDAYAKLETTRTNRFPSTGTVYVSLGRLGLQLMTVNAGGKEVVRDTFYVDGKRVKKVDLAQMITE